MQTGTNVCFVFASAPNSGLNSLFPLGQMCTQTEYE